MGTSITGTPTKERAQKMCPGSLDTEKIELFQLCEKVLKPGLMGFSHRVETITDMERKRSSVPIYCKANDYQRKC